MISLNIPNALTIGLISIGALMLYKMVAPKVGLPSV